MRWQTLSLFGAACQMPVWFPRGVSTLLLSEAGGGRWQCDKVKVSSDQPGNLFLLDTYEATVSKYCKALCSCEAGK